MESFSMVDRTKEELYSGFQLWSLVALRVLVGWHFLYEGIAKILNPHWSSVGYLNEAQGFFSGLFEWIVVDPTRVAIVDICNMYGLMAIGLGMFLGVLTRTATVSAAALLLIYYLVTPPFVGLSYQIPFEGSYLVVNKTLIEFAGVLVLIAFPTGTQVGFDRLIERFRTTHTVKKTATGRREEGPTHA